jgi:hypothetical protein
MNKNSALALECQSLGKEDNLAIVPEIYLYLSPKKGTNKTPYACRLLSKANIGKRNKTKYKVR